MGTASALALPSSVTVCSSSSPRVSEEQAVASQFNPDADFSIGRSTGLSSVRTWRKHSKTAAGPAAMSIPPDLQPILRVLNGVRPGDNLDTALSSCVAGELDPDKAGRATQFIANPDVVLLFFDWVSLRFQHNVFSCNCALDMLCRLNRRHDALHLFRRKMTNICIPNKFTYGILIRGFCSDGDLEIAMELLEEMKKNGFEGNAVVHTTLIKGLCDAGRVAEALNQFRSMSDECTPDVMSYSSLVHALCKEGRFDNAHGFLLEMISKGCSPDEITFNILVDGLCKFGVEGEASRILEAVIQSGVADCEAHFESIIQRLCKYSLIEIAGRVLEVVIGKGFTPTVLMFNLIINGFCKMKDLDGAYKLLELMIERSCAPNVFTFSILINGLCKAGRVDEAEQLLEKMVNGGCAPNVVTYSTVISGLCQQAARVDDAVRLFQIMEDRGCAANVVTHNILINGFCKAKRVDEAQQQLQRMMSDGCLPDLITYNSLVDGLCKLSRVDEACGVIKLMPEDCDQAPNAVTLNTLLLGFAYSGRFQEACEIFAVLVEKELQPDLVSLTSLILEYCRRNRAADAVLIVEAMAQNGFDPRVNTLTAVLGGLFNEGQAAKASQVFGDLMQRDGWIDDLNLYEIVIEGLVRAGKLDEAVDALRKVVEKSLVPDASIVNALIHSLCGSGRDDDAKRVIEEVMGDRAGVSSFDCLINGMAMAGRLDETAGIVERMVVNRRSDLRPRISTVNVVVWWLCDCGRVEDAYEFVQRMAKMDVCDPDVRICNTIISGYCRAGRIDLARKLIGEMTEAGIEADDLTRDVLDGGSVDAPSVI